MAREESRPLTSYSNGSAKTSAPATVPASSASQGTSYASYRTAEERAAYIKQQAEQRMAERLAALGIKSMKIGETAQDRAERQRKEQEERLRKAEEEEAKREQERQRKLEGESIAPPTPVKQAKKPPPPPTRKGGHASTSSVDTRKVEQELKAEQGAQESERHRME